VEEEVVDYEPWMDDYGRSSHGVEFDADDQLCSLHPEVWLSSKVVREIRDESTRRHRKEMETAAAAAASSAAAAAAAAASSSTQGKKKEGKKDGTKKKKQKDKQNQQQQHIHDNSAGAATAAAPPIVKKGIANKKNRGIMDDLDVDASFLNDDDFDLEGADGDFLELVDAEDFEDLGLDFGGV
jgi:ribosome assembly protein YihI (activator of Der GTPase)